MKSKQLRQTKYFKVLICLFIVSIIMLPAVYLSNGSPAQAEASNSFLLTLTEEERIWLSDHPVVRVTQDPGWPPIEFADAKGMPTGMTRDYVKLIAQKLGVTFEFIPASSWQEAYTKLKNWEIDMTTSVAVTPERLEFWAFTKPYMDIPIIIVAAANVTYVSDIRQLEGEKVALVDSYAVSDWLPRDYPAIDLVKVNNVLEGIEMVRRGEVFAYIENMLVVSYYFAQLKTNDLKIVGETPYINAQSMAVRKDWAILAGILDKALDSITEAERNEIYQRWLPVRYEHGFDYTLLWRLLGIFTLVLLGTLFWILRLKSEIKARKKAEADLRKSEASFKKLFQFAPLPMGLIDKDGKMIAVNAQWLSVFGYSLEEIPTINEWWQYAYPDPAYRRQVLKEWEQNIQDAREIESEIKGSDYRITCRNGEERIMEITGAFLGDDVLAAFFDITERKKMETAISESKARYRNILEVAPVGIAVHQNSKIVFTNPAGLRILGADSYEQLIGKDIKTIIHPDNLQTSGNRIKSLMAGEQGLYPVEDRYLKLDGSVIDVEVMATLLNYNNEPAVQVIVTDITEKKKNREELRRLNAELESKVNDRTMQLKAANKELEAFTYSVSHDLRAPLRSINGFSELLMTDYKDMLNNDGLHYLDRIKSAVQRMKDLIEDMLKLSQASRRELASQQVDLSLMAEEIISDLRESELDRIIVSSITPDLSAKGDPHLLRAVLENLLGNAWKFSSQEPRAAIEVGRTTVDGEEVYFVRDNGVGFNMAYADKLFGAFQRLHGADEFPGTGIGLATVQRIVNRHSGRIWAESEVGKGATFYFTLPQ